MSHWQKKAAEWRQETVKRQTETKGTDVPSKFIMYWALNAHLPLPQDRESSITITIQTLSKFMKVQSKHLMHLFSSCEVGLDSSFDANSWSQRQREHEEQLTTPNLKDVTQGIYYKDCLDYCDSEGWIGPLCCLHHTFGPLRLTGSLVRIKIISLERCTLCKLITLSWIHWRITIFITVTLASLCFYKAKSS